MPEANYRLNVEINTIAKSSGNFTDPAKNLNNLRNAALTTAKAFGPMAARINKAFADLAGKRQARTAGIFGGISTGVKGEVDKISAGMEQLKDAAKMATENMLPVRQAVRDSISSIDQLNPGLKDFHTALNTVANSSNITTDSVKGLALSANFLAGKTSGPVSKGFRNFGVQLTTLGQQASVSKEELQWVGTQLDDLLIKTIKLPQPLKQAMTAFSGAIPTTEAATRKWITLAQVASTSVVPGFEQMSQAFGASIAPLEMLANALAALKTPPDIQAFLNELDKGVPKTEAAAIKLRDLAMVASQDATPKFAALTAAILANKQAFDDLILSKQEMKMPPEMAAVQKDFMGAAPTTAQAANKIFKDMQVALQNTIPEYAGVREVMASVSAESEQLTGDLEELTAEQRRNMQAARGMTTHTVEANEALLVTQSLAQGAMMGYAAMRGSILQLGFGLIFMRFSAIKLVLSMALLVAVLGNLQKVLIGVGKALYDNGKLFLEQEYLARRFELDISKVAEAYPALARAAIAAGRTIEDVSKSWEAWMSIGQASAETQASANDLAAKTGTSLAEASSRMVEVIKGGSDGIEEYARSMGETNIEVIRAIKAQWNLQTPLERTGILMRMNAKYAKDAGKDYAMSFAALKQGISDSWKYATGKLGSPFISKFLNPMLAAFRDVGLAAMGWVDAFMDSKTGISLMKDLAKTGKMAADLIKSALHDLGEIIQAILPPLIRLVNVGLRMLVMILTPLAKNMKLVIATVAILGAIATKVLGGIILKSIANLTAFKTAIRTVSLAFDNFRLSMMMAGGGIKGLFVGIQMLTAGFIEMTAAMLSNPWVQLAALIGLVAIAIMKDQKCMEAFQKVIAAAQPIIASLSQIVSALADILSGAVLPIISVLIKIVAGPLTLVLNAVAIVLNGLFWLVKKIVSPFKFLGTTLKWIIGIFFAYWAAIKIGMMIMDSYIIMNWTYIGVTTAVRVAQALLTKETWRQIAAWIALRLAMLRDIAINIAAIGVIVASAVAMKAAKGATYAWAAANKVLGVSWVVALAPLALVLAVVTALIAASAALYIYWNKIPKLIRYFVTGMHPLFGLIKIIREWNLYMERTKKLLLIFSNAVDALAGSLEQLVHWILGKSPGLIPALKMVTPLLIYFTRFMRQAGSVLWGVVTAAKNVVVWVKSLPKLFTDIATAVGGAFSILPGIIGGFFSDAFTAATNAWSTANTDFQIIVSGVAATFDTIVNAVSTSFSNALTAATNAWSTANTSFQTIATGVGDSFNVVVSIISGCFTNALTESKKVFDTAFGTATAIFDTIAAGCGHAFDTVSGIISGCFQTALTDSKKVFDTAFGTATAVFDTIATGIGNSFNVVTGIIGGIFTTAFSEATKVATTAWMGLKFLLSDMGAWFTEFVVLPLVKGFNVLIQAWRDTLGRLPGAPKISLIDEDYIREQITALKLAATLAQANLIGAINAGTVIPNITRGVGATAGYGHPVYEMARGGITFPNRPILAQIGEGREREAIAPLSELSRYLVPAQPTIVVHVTGNTIMNEAMVDTITDKVSDKVTRAMSRFRPISTVGY